MKVIDMPTEVPAQVPNHLDTFDDWYALIGTCCRLYHACAECKATFAVSEVVRQGSRCVFPPPLILIGSGRQLADWAIKHAENRRRLEAASLRGCDGADTWEAGDGEGMLELCVAVARWTVADLRALIQSRLDIITPLSRILEAELARKRIEGSRNPTEPAITGDFLTCYEADEVLCMYVFYCDLFHHNIDQAYGQLPAGVRPLEDSIRYLWIECCMPSAIPWPNDQREKPKLGRFRPRSYNRLSRADAFPNFHSVVQSLLGKAHSTTQPSHPIHKGLSPHEILFARIMQHQGLTTWRLLLPDGISAISDIAARIRKDVDALPIEHIFNKPERHQPNWLPLGWYSMALDCDYNLGET